ncbi:MAG TPA: hypothetical protein VHU82_04590 [Vicinamibacterales bacterium]|nr:hypothetical protein [Vicinamibacterales bacterium]
MARRRHARADFLWSHSLLLTSDAIGPALRLLVEQAIGPLQQADFAKETMTLRHFANYRTTDNWWNLYVGHREAYAATNFPLGVVTLYPAFFEVPVDDTERAAQTSLSAGRVPSNTLP